MLPAGTNALTVTFTPTDSANYTTATASVRLLVQAALKTILAASSTTQLATMPLIFTAQVAVSYNFPLSPLVTPTFLSDVHLTARGLPPAALGTHRSSRGWSARFTAQTLPSRTTPARPRNQPRLWPCWSEAAWTFP